MQEQNLNSEQKNETRLASNPNSINTDLSGSAIRVKQMLKEYIVSTVDDKYEAIENIMASSLKDAAIIFAKCYHRNLRNLSRNEVSVLVIDKVKKTESKFKLKAETKVFYYAESV